MANKIVDIEERVSRSLQGSLNELYLLRQEEAAHLDSIKERSRSIVMELKDLAAAIDKTNTDYNLSRAELLDKSKRGESYNERFSYERASEFMKLRGSLEERYRLLNAQKTELTQEELRLERVIAKSENMGNRLRMVLNLISTPEEVSVSTDAHNAEAMLTAFLLAEREAAAFAREIHDSPTQTFSAVGLILEIGQEYLKRQEYDLVNRELDRALEQTRNGLSELRSFLFSLSPTGIESGFDLPMKRLVSQIGQMWDCMLSFTLSGNMEEVSANVRIAAFKTLHQAVLNAAKHGATDVKVTIANHKSTLRVRVIDNGDGFDVEQERIAARERGSYGLINMEDRVRMLGGKISISSVLKKGSNVAFSIPIVTP